MSGVITSLPLVANHFIQVMFWVKGKYIRLTWNIIYYKITKQNQLQKYQIVFMAHQNIKHLQTLNLKTI
jgi:hypothetical protein